MGNTSSSKPKAKETQHFNLYLKALQNDKKKYLTARTVSTDYEPENHCPRIANSVSAIFSNEEKRVVYNTKWKTNLIQQLSNLKNEDWPAILLTFLKSWDQDSVDLNYQSQISWIDFNNTRSLKLSSSNIDQYRNSFTEGEIRKKTISICLSKLRNNPSIGPILIVKQKEKGHDDEEHKINEMLDQTSLLEENFFAAHSRPSMIQRSFIGIKPTLSGASNKRSIDESLDGGNASEEEKKSSTPVKVQDQTVDLYKGNTFLNHLPVTLSKVSLGIPDPSKASSNMQLIQSISNYRLITGLLEKHLRSPSCVFYQIMNKFTEFYVDRYEKVVDAFNHRTMSNAELSTKTSHAVVDLQQFIRLLYESINSFYKLDRLKMGDAAKENIFNRDNMLNFITSIVFNERLYFQIFEILRIKDFTTEVAFVKSMELCSSKPPEYLGIAPEFCLNERTLEYYFNDVESAFNNLVAEEPKRKKTGQKDKPFILDIMEQNDRDSSEDMNLNRSSSQTSDLLLGGAILPGKEILSRRTTESKLAYAKKLLKDPYITCINVLKKIEKQRSPIHKMKAIVKTAELINLSIQNFYKTFKITKSFKLDADQTLSIFMYIVGRAEVKSLATHIKSIEKFATNNVLNSISGYYATTLEACVNCIINMDFSDNDPSENFLDNLVSQNGNT